VAEICGTDNLLIPISWRMRTLDGIGARKQLEKFKDFDALRLWDRKRDAL
jgi:hypothetical protein